MAKTKIAVLISGRGSNMQAIVDAAQAEDYPAEIALVVSNNPDAAGLAWAAERGIETEVLNHRDYETREEFEKALDTLIRLYGARIVCLAGFMRILTPFFTEKWRDLLINVHPSLLPSFKGLHTHERALEAGVRIHGCTVHYVRPEMDDGPIIGQAAVPVLHGDTPDTLAARVLEAEHQLYPQCIALACSGKARVAGERVRLQVREFGADLLMNPHD
ncbi:phosphoribosylglycinamide formyltransferase [Maricaulis sp.]|uniref:phosphoribosylglycinamide formyltransferase n=1 Tax=unclassified Maricaulis TaxID=2632371 RepID=UPI001B1F9248|nr:phosphoribosylglycinamide formyltransferase [Maricaulis sp.]MBO6798329.1 phosphoribosylglycinamide formyltransferase [Maricaulis sp.]